MKTNKIDKKKLEVILKRISHPKDRDWFRQFLINSVENGILALELLDEIPIRSTKIEKTRFDQLYDACMELVFPGYRSETLKKLIGPAAAELPDIKIWRVLFPAKFKITHVLIRAISFQEAFAFACDYACRTSVRTCQIVPNDLTIRVQFVSEKAIRRMLEMRWANRVKKRKELQLLGRTFTNKELHGARLAALGHPKQPYYSIMKYAEANDLRNVLLKHHKVRISMVETETFRTSND